MSAASVQALLRLTDASVHFGSVQALQKVGLTVNRGDFIALVGANGSGKTSLLRLLNGMLSHGGSREVADTAATQAMVFQKPFVLRLSVWNNLRIALWLAGVPREQRSARAQQALQRVGLLQLRERPARALSGGQLQRLALARAWGVQPRILFLDEPTPGSVGEEGSRSRARRLCCRRHDPGDEHAQPGPGQTPGHARGVPRPGRNSARPTHRCVFR